MAFNLDNKSLLLNIHRTIFKFHFFFSVLPFHTVLFHKLICYIFSTAEMLQVNGNEGFQRERMSSKEQDGYPFDFWLQVNLKHELPFRFNKNPSLGQPSFSPKNLCRSHASDTFPVRPQLLCASWKNQKYRAGHLFPEKIQGKSYNKSWISPNMTQEITQEGGKKSSQLLETSS